MGDSKGTIMIKARECNGGRESAGQDRWKMRVVTRTPVGMPQERPGRKDTTCRASKEAIEGYTTRKIAMNVR